MQVDEHGPKTQIKSQKVTADATKNINFYYWVPKSPPTITAKLCNLVKKIYLHVLL